METDGRVNSQDAGWEGVWAPYDRPTYKLVLEKISPGDVVLDIGAGDLRLSREIARVARKVSAIEQQETLVRRSLELSPAVANLEIIIGDARQIPFPCGITTGVLLMRHCTQFQLYCEKLVEAGAKRLITNARWRMGVEQVSLSAPRASYASLGIGWYACACGGVGFKEGPVEMLTEEVLEIQNEVFDCPECQA